MVHPNRQGADRAGALTGSDGAPPATVDVAAYLTSVLPQLRTMAERADLNLTAYLLDMARLELEEQRERHRAGAE